MKIPPGFILVSSLNEKYIVTEPNKQRPMIIAVADIFFVKESHQWNGVTVIGLRCLPTESVLCSDSVATILQRMVEAQS